MKWISVEDKFPNVEDKYLVYISIDLDGVVKEFTLDEFLSRCGFVLDGE